jgi:ABC-type antimicrobial peptide transport system permease subunit
MKTNVCLISSLRSPFRSLLLLILIGLISFGFITKAVEYILVQSQTEVLGSYYRSIGVLENVNDVSQWWCNPSKTLCQYVTVKSGDVSAGIDLIKTSPYFAYGDQREIVSGVMPQTYNQNRIDTNITMVMETLPPEYWPNTHTYDIWFSGELIDKEEVKDDIRAKNKKTIGYYLKFNIDTLLASAPQYAKQGSTVALLFMFEGHESAIASIQAMEIGQRYFIRGWDDMLQQDFSWENTHYAYLEIKPLDDRQLWYIPIEKEASVDLSDPVLAPFKNEIDVLNENLHTLGIIATADMSAMPMTQEASRTYYLTAGRWLNHLDDLAGNKVIVVPEEFAKLRGFKLGDEITLTFRPLTDTYFGLIRDGVDSQNWRSYPTYQDTFTIVGLYARTTYSGIYAYIPTSSLRPGFTSATQNQFRYEADYSFVLDSPRNETRFIQEYKVPLQELGIHLTFLANNGAAYWASVDPIRRSLSADILVFGLLLVVALILAVFLYVMARKRDYAILRALGVPAKQANGQIIMPLLLLGGFGSILGGLPSWSYAIHQAKASLSTLPTPAGVSPSADISPFILAGLCAAIFLLLALFSWLGVFFLSRQPVYELLQGGTSRPQGRQKRTRIGTLSRQPIPSLSSSLTSTVDHAGNTRKGAPLDKVNLASRRKYTPSSLSRYVLHHLLRSRVKSFLTLAIALVFMLASGWIRQTMERSQVEVDRLYDTTVVEADIIPADRSDAGSNFVYLNTIDSALNSGFVKSSVLEADTIWHKIKKLDSQDVLTGNFPVYAYDSPEAFNSGLADPGALIFTPGWDMNLFAKPRTMEEIQNEGIPALFPANLLEQLQLNVGETVRIAGQSSQFYNCVIIGQYSGGRASTGNSNIIHMSITIGDYILIPLSALESMDGSQTKFTVAHFSLDPKKNRELPQLRADMEKVMQAYGGKLRFVIWDEELRIVLAQLDKNLSLLKVLYPVVIAVSVLIGAGLCFLLLLQATRETAILRVLGTTRTAVRLALIFEPLFLSIIGVILGLGIARFLWMTSDLVLTIPLLTGAGLYLTGVSAGLVIGAISVTNKKPIELLQVKE